MDTPTTISEYQDKTLELCELLKSCRTEGAARSIERQLRDLNEDIADLHRGISIATLHASSLSRTIGYRLLGDEAAARREEEHDRENRKKAPQWLKF